jgi:hypothetical protein
MSGPVELIQCLPARSVARGLDPRVHLLRIKVFLRKGWIAGSSPAMTAETEATSVLHPFDRDLL